MGRKLGSKNKQVDAVVKSDTIFIDESNLPWDVTPREFVEGWINVQCIVSFVGAKKVTHYFTGGDIHPNIDSAKKVASTNTIGQVYIKFPLKDK